MGNESLQLRSCHLSGVNSFAEGEIGIDGQSLKLPIFLNHDAYDLADEAFLLKLVIVHYLLFSKHSAC